MSLGALFGAGILAVILAAAVRPSAQVSQLLPVDEAASDPDFFAFRARLQRAIAGHDVRALLSVIDPAIRVSFGPENGRDAFRRDWQLDGPSQESSGIWTELGAVLALGGQFDTPDTFVAPYVFSRWPDRVDAFEHVALVGADVRIRSEPRANARVVTSLSFAIVPLARTVTPPDGWTAVRLGGDRVGFVSSALVRSPIDYRAFFARRNGDWRLLLFVAGD